MGMMDIRRRILLNNPHIETANGAVASFNTGLTLPVKELQIGIEPVQEGSGDPSPENVRPISGWTGCNTIRTGKNMIPTGTDTNNGYVANSWMDSSGVVTSLSSTGMEYVSEYFRVVGGETYTASEKKSGSSGLNNAGLCFYDKNKNYISGEAFLQRLVFTITAPTNACYCRITSFYDTYTSNSVMFEKGSSASVYEAYNGTTQFISFAGCGKNLLFKKLSGENISSSGTISSNSSYDCYVAEVTSGQKYVVSGNTDVDNGYVIAFYSTEPVHGSTSYDSNRVISTTTRVFTAPINGYVAVRSYSTDTSVQCERGETPTSYEPYGTVYGGTLTLNKDGTGTIVVNWAEKSITDIDSFDTTLNDKKIKRYAIEKQIVFSATKLIVKAERLKSTTFNGRGDAWTIYPAAANTINVCADVDTTIEEYNSKLSGSKFVYEFVYPVTYTLTASQIRTLFGQNNIFADTGDIIKCDYWKQ